MSGYKKLKNYLISGFLLFKGPPKLRRYNEKEKGDLTTTKGTKEWACKNVNFSKGCSHGCRYCYARRMAHRFGWKNYEDWTKMENKPEFATKKYKKHSGWIMSPSSHDITSSNVDLAINVFTNILKAENNLLIVSKPSYRIIQVLCEKLEPWQNQILFRFTIGTMNDKVRRYWEPFAPSISQRIKTLRYTHKHGWNNSVSIEPFLDDTVLELIDTLNPYVTDSIWIGPMNRVHVPRELWSEELTKLYSPESLIELKTQIDALENSKIRYKDHFLSISKKYKKLPLVKAGEYQTKLTQITIPSS